MSTDYRPRVTVGNLAPYAGAFAVGLVLMGISAMTYWRQAYLTSQPAVGSVSMPWDGVVFYLVLFLAGSTLAFNGVMLALSTVFEGTGIDDR